MPCPASDIALSAVSWASACLVSCRSRSSRSLTPTASIATIRALRRSSVTAVHAARRPARACSFRLVSRAVASAARVKRSVTMRW